MIPSTPVMHSVCRFHPGGHGVNVLTSDRVTDMGGGPAFHSNLVKVSRA